ncbi:MAG: IS66 family transposase [Alphaproteobacteria bacterium]
MQASFSDLEYDSKRKQTRREIFEAKTNEPQIAEQGLKRIKALYAVEEQIRAQTLKRVGRDSCKTQQKQT